MPRQKTGSASHGFSAEDVARIDSWIIEIAAKQLGSVAPEEANGASATTAASSFTVMVAGTTTSTRRLVTAR
jgi:hypothetical protein